MRVAIIGLGAIGRVLVAALEGVAPCEVVRLDRTHAPPREQEAPVDVAVICVKTPGTAWAVSVAERILRPGGAALTLQNGLGNRERLAEAFGPSRVAAAALYLGVYVDERGGLVVSGTPRLELAMPGDAAAAAVLEAFFVILRGRGWDIGLEGSWAAPLWRKLVVNAAINPASAILGIENGRIPGHPAAALVADILAMETARVASAIGVAIDDAAARTGWRAAAAHAPTNRSSMLQDVRAGRETEIDAICGAVARTGDGVGVSVPLNAVMTSLISALRP